MAYPRSLAGAEGTVGKRLTPLLLEVGHHVTGTTRLAAEGRGAAGHGSRRDNGPLCFRCALVQPSPIAPARAEIVIHQLTDLPRGFDPGWMAQALVGNARICDEGARNIVRGPAIAGGGPRRLVAQSIAWVYAPGREPHGEDDLPGR